MSAKNQFELLRGRIIKNKSFLCAGMDPKGLNEREFYVWARIVVETLSPYVACFKPNASFYFGDGGEEALRYICSNQETVSILDIKAGDIGNTQLARAKKVYDSYNPNFVTITGYMGDSTWKPFEELGIGTFVVGKSSNPEGIDFQERYAGGLSNSEFIATQVNPEHHGLVVGAGNDLEAVRRIRALNPDAWWLMPGGIGPQAKPESLKTLAYANGLAIVNASRGLTGIPEGMDWKSQEYKDLLVERAEKFNAIINENMANTDESWADIVVDGLVTHNLAIVSGYTDENNERAFWYKHENPKVGRHDFTTYCQIRHLIGTTERTQEACVHLMAEKFRNEIGGKVDAIVPVPMGAVGFVNNLGKALKAPTWILRPEKEGAGNQDAVIGIRTMPKGAFQRNYSPDKPERKTVRILMVEDIFSSGNSSIKEANRLVSVLDEHYNIAAEVVILALATNTLTATERIEQAGYKAYACLTIPEIASVAARNLPKDEAEIVRQDIIERFDVDITKPVSTVV